MASITVNVKMDKLAYDRMIEELSCTYAAALCRFMGISDSEFKKPSNNEGLMELDQKYGDVLREVVKRIDTEK